MPQALVDPAAPADPGGAQRDVLGQHLARLPRRTLAIALSLLPIVALVNAGVLVWSLGGIDLSRKLVAPHLLALVLPLVFVPMLANSLRLAIWGRFLGLDLGFAGALRVITGTMIANSVTPTAAGGTPIKVLLLLGEGIAVRRGVSLISLQAAEDALVMFGLMMLCIGVSGFAMADYLGSDPAFYARLDQTLRSAALIVVGALLAVTVVGALIAAGLFGRRVAEWSARGVQKLRSWTATIIGDWIAVLRSGKAVAMVTLALALLQWGVRFSIAGLVLAAFGTEWQPALFWLLQYLVQSISSTVPTPGGVGGAEAAFLLLFAPFVERAVLFPAMSTWRLLFFYLPLVGAAVTFFALRRSLLRRAKGNAEALLPDAAPVPAE
jgi:hypothetical protein